MATYTVFWGSNIGVLRVEAGESYLAAVEAAGALCYRAPYGVVIVQHEEGKPAVRWWERTGPRGGLSDADIDL